MKSSKRKRGLPPAGAAAKRTGGQHDVEIKAPSSEEWENIVRDLKLTPAQERTLKNVLDAALDDIGRYHQKLKDQPSRELLVDRLKRFTKVLGRLRDECERSVDLMQHILPQDVLGYIGQSLTFSAMSEALGRDVSPGISISRSTACEPAASALRLSPWTKTPVHCEKPWVSNMAI
jgi:hypothetical protein